MAEKRETAADLAAMLPESFKFGEEIIALTQLKEVEGVTKGQILTAQSAFIDTVETSVVRHAISDAEIVTISSLIHSEDYPFIHTAAAISRLGVYQTLLPGLPFVKASYKEYSGGGMGSITPYYAGILADSPRAIFGEYGYRRGRGNVGLRYRFTDGRVRDDETWNHYSDVVGEKKTEQLVRSWARGRMSYLPELEDEDGIRMFAFNDEVKRTNEGFLVLSALNKQLPELDNLQDEAQRVTMANLQFQTQWRAHEKDPEGNAWYTSYSRSQTFVKYQLKYLRFLGDEGYRDILFDLVNDPYHVDLMQLTEAVVESKLQLSRDVTTHEKNLAAYEAVKEIVELVPRPDMLPKVNSLESRDPWLIGLHANFWRAREVFLQERSRYNLGTDGHGETSSLREYDLNDSYKRLRTESESLMDYASILLNEDKLSDIDAVYMALLDVDNYELNDYPAVETQTEFLESYKQMAPGVELLLWSSGMNRFTDEQEFIILGAGVLEERPVLAYASIDSPNLHYVLKGQDWSMASFGGDIHWTVGDEVVTIVKNLVEYCMKPDAKEDLYWAYINSPRIAILLAKHHRALFDQSLKHIFDKRPTPPKAWKQLAPIITETRYRQFASLSKSKQRKLVRSVEREFYARQNPELGKFAVALNTLFAR